MSQDPTDPPEDPGGKNYYVLTLVLYYFENNFMQVY